jgi:hypothetical protein
VSFSYFWCGAIHVRETDGFSVLPPIPTEGLTAADVDSLCTRTRNAMQEELIRLAHLNATSSGVSSGLSYAASAPPPLVERKELRVNGEDVKRRQVKTEY